MANRPRSFLISKSPNCRAKDSAALFHFIWDMSEDDDEFLIEGGSPFDGPSPDLPPFNSAGLAAFHAVVTRYPTVLPAAFFEFTEVGGVLLHLPKDFMPPSLLAIYCLNLPGPLLEISFVLDDYDWQRRPRDLVIAHPTLGASFVGHSLVRAACERFFLPSYKPCRSYRCQNGLLPPIDPTDDDTYRLIVAAGFSPEQAARALAVAGGEGDGALQFLQLGVVPPPRGDLPVAYEECPLLYLLLEIGDAFLHLSDHCCCCGKAMPLGLKPSVCDDEMCNFQLSRMGIGQSLHQEIQRDPLVADLLVSVFASAVGTRFLTPAPPPLMDADAMGALSQRLPRMADLVRLARNDAALKAQLGDAPFELLRWAILSNRAHLMALPRELALDFPDCHQFMSLLAAPEAEDVFQQLKKRFGSSFFWHGSAVERWHSIIRNGLKNATGTELQANGAVRGAGIYLATNSRTSLGYAKMAKNRYAQSVLRDPLTVLALLEVANVPSDPVTVEVVRSDGVTVNCSGFLKDHGITYGAEVWTCSMEEAVVVRFLVVGGNFGVDVRKNPPKRVPTLTDVLQFHSART
jgi:poly [ADP-ribose] polymerase 6/8